MGQLAEAGRQRGYVGLAQVKPLPPLLPTRQEGPGQVKVGGGSALLLALTRNLDLLPDLHSDTLLTVTELLVAVLSENHGEVIILSSLMIPSPVGCSGMDTSS